MNLRFGIFDHLEKRQDVPLQQQYRERLELVAQADRAGFYAYHVAEHHNSPLCMAPSQNLYLTAVAQRTERLLFGPLVYLLPLYHPLRLIEEVSMLDNLGGGRLQVGVGRGISPLEHAFWGHNPDEAPERFEETLAILVRGLTRDRLDFEGKYYRFRDVPIELSTLQKPYPPFWYAGNVEYAAKNGMNFIGGGGQRSLPAMAARYRELWEEGRGRVDRINPHVTEPMIGTSRHILVAETDEEAKLLGRRAWTAYHGNFAKRGHATTQVGRPTQNASLGGQFELARKVEACVVGSAATVRAYVARYAAKCDMNYFVAAFQWGDLTHAEASRSMELFAAEIMPTYAAALRDDAG